MLNPGTDLDLALEPRDQLILFELIDVESRTTLLAPIIRKLRAQAKEGEPVQVVSISGAVKAPGDYPLAQGDRAFALVRAAGGLKDSAFLAAVELRRIIAAVSGSVDLEYRELSFEAFGQLADANNLLLQSRDHITVRDIPDWNPGELVEVRGEVRFPGDYLIRRGETIAEIIARAGGLTEDAFPQGAIFTRVETARLENERAAELAGTITADVATSMLTQETRSVDFAEITSITETLQNFEGKGRLLVDLDKALAGVAGENLVLVDGDRLVIPQKFLTVSIIGQVRRQGTHVFQSDYDVKDYLSLAAGMTSRADKKAMYIVKANGAVMSAKTSWLKFSNPQQQLAPGDTIVVPVNNRYKDSLSGWRDITQIMYQSAVALAAIGL
jgi:polysaccharide export outer membrane protein